MSLPPDDVRVGLAKPSLLRSPVRWLQWHVYRFRHKRYHNHNRYFYPPTPKLMEGMLRAFAIQAGRGLLKDSAYYEFGVFRGFSFFFAEVLSRHFAAEGFDLYGFDSFEGLPDSAVDGTKPAFQKNHYAANLDFVQGKLREMDVDLEKARLFKGYYGEEFFTGIEEGTALKPASVCVMDCDVYESCRDALPFLRRHLVVGSIILFDDYNCFFESDEHGERRALLEFEKANPSFRKRHVFDFGWHGAAFEVTAL